MTTRISIVIVAVALAACSKSGSLVAITVDANPPLSNVAKLTVTMTASGRSQTSDVPLSPSAIPPEHTFGVDVGPDVTGSFMVTASAIDSTGKTVATTTGATTIVAAGTATLTLTFGIAPPDLAMPHDLRGVDLAMPPPGDMALPPIVFTSQIVNGGIGPFSAVWGGDASHMWISGQSSANTYFSTGNDVWTQFSTNPFYNVYGLFGFSSNSGWMVDDSGDIRILDSTGTSWGQGVQLPVALTGVWGTSATNMWVIYNDSPNGGAYHNTTGNNLLASWVDAHDEAGGGFNAIHGVAPDNFYIVGDSGKLLHCDGVQYNYVGLGANALRGVWAADATHVYVVGDGGVLGFSPGNNVFTEQTVPAAVTSINFRAVWASGIDDIYVVGDSNTMLHSTGNGTWQAVTTGLDSTHNLQAVFGTSSRNVYAVSSTGGITHGQ